MDEAEVKRKLWENRFKIGLGLLAALVIGPFTFVILNGLLGMAALGVAAAVGFACVQLAPVFSMKLANWRMKLIVGEAEKNPIETMKNLFIEKTAELHQADDNIAEFEAEIGNFADQTTQFKERYPEEADHYETILEKMREALADMKREQSTARRELRNFEQKIQKAEAIYKMSLAAQKVVKLSKSAEAQVFAQIKEQVAFDTVRTQLNRSFANLNLAVERRADTRAVDTSLEERRRAAHAAQAKTASESVRKTL